MPEPHPDAQRCDSRRDVGLVGYQVIVEVISERRNLTRSLLVDLPLSATALPVPAVFLEQGTRLPDTVYNIEVHAIEDTGNRTFAEQPFLVARPSRSASGAVGR